jgi:hypothetical protein
MKELVQLQQELFKTQTEVKELKKKVEVLEAQITKDVKDLRVEAEKVLEKASALVNPYSTKTVSWDKK